MRADPRVGTFVDALQAGQVEKFPCQYQLSPLDSGGHCRKDDLAPEPVHHQAGEPVRLGEDQPEGVGLGMGKPGFPAKLHRRGEAPAEETVVQGNRAARKEPEEEIGFRAHKPPAEKAAILAQKVGGLAVLELSLDPVDVTLKDPDLASGDGEVLLRLEPNSGSRHPGILSPLVRNPKIGTDFSGHEFPGSTFKLVRIPSTPTRSIMKVIPLSEAKANLSRYAQLCHKEPVIVTGNGVPVFQMVPLNEKDDLIDRLIEHHPEFKKLLKERLQEKSIAASEAYKRL